jgi:hypothetical protein
MGEEERIVRVPLPVSLIRRMDELLTRGTGGLHVRADFIREAVEAMVLELSYAPAPDEPAAQALSSSGGLGRPLSQESAHRWCAPAHEGSAFTLEATKLYAPDSVITVADRSGDVVDEPLFGLHNRDYPSIFAAHHLALLTKDELVGLGDFQRSVMAAAWRFGEQLLPLEERLNVKLSALFPTNKRKPQSAEDGFLTFAVGTYSGEGSEIRLSGPLFLWRMCQVAVRDGQLLIGLTEEGRQLLNALDGLSLKMPHDRDHAECFFSHLRAHAPRDWWGFGVLLRAASGGITRAELIEAFGRAEPSWGDSTSETNAAGYVARAREWGLLEPKQVHGRYALTAFGEEQLQKELMTGE